MIWAVYKLLGKLKQPLAMGIAAACGSLTNTVLYLGLMLLFYILCGIDNTKVLTTIAAVAGGAGPLEALAAAIITPPDVVSQIMVAVPMIGLYELSILICKDKPVEMIEE